MAEKIAIIGYACRLPDRVSTPDELWELCTRRRDGWTEIPQNRFSAEAFHHPNPTKPGSFNPKGGYFLKEDISKFDASFFNLTAKEAISLDPQQRFLLECTFEALESAGIPKENFAGRDVGVYVGSNFADYEIMNLRDIDTAPMHQATGCVPAMQSNRISYCFDLRGPSMTFDTACSGSLVALHHAVRSLSCGESTEAIVAGCRLNILPDYFVTMSMSQLLNDVGKTFPFDNRALSGFARGEGAGVIILKPLEAAIRDRDPIRAVIQNSGVNQDGRTQGITNPNGQAQRDLIRKVYLDAGLDPKDCAYAEMHGTGTKVGDPIEASAMHQAISHSRSSRDPLYVGSVKSNVGHLEGASGVISLIKAAMMLEKEFLLPSTNFRHANPAIPLKDWNMEVLTSTRPWPRHKKYVSVSNYGFGGANAHAVLGKPPIEARQVMQPSDDELTDPSTYLFVISANDKVSLQARMKGLGVYFEQRPEAFEKLLCPNAAYTLGNRRSHLSYRKAIVAKSLDELVNKLAQTTLHFTRVVGQPRIGFVFTGQGAQWAEMGIELFKYPIFESAMTRADEYLRTLGAEFSLIEEMRRPQQTSSMNSPHISQPACTAIQIGMVNLFKSWGIQPGSVVGHSSGEIAAAYAAHVINADDTMALAYYRGKMTSELKQRYPALKGGMIAVGVGTTVVEPLLKQVHAGYITIACVNSPSSVTISGDESAIAELQQILDAKSIFCRRLKIDVAYHSKHMASVSELYLASIAGRHPERSQSARFFSSVYSREIKSCELVPSYWVDNLLSTVQFSDALREMCQDEQRPDLLIEIGPHAALKGPVKDILKDLSIPGIKIGYTSALMRNTDAIESMLEAVGVAHTKGAILDMTSINFPNTHASFCSLLMDIPKYDWQHSTSYWHESRITKNHSLREGGRNDILGTMANYSNTLEPTWRNIVRLDDIPWLRHHKMQGLSVFPIAGYISMAIEAVHQRANTRATTFDFYELHEVKVSAALVIQEGVEIEMIFNLRPYNDASRDHSGTWDEFKIFSWESNRGWEEHCRGLIRVGEYQKEACHSSDLSARMKSAALHQSISEAELHATQLIDDAKMYEELESMGAGYGSTFRGLQNCRTGPNHSRADISVPNTRQHMPKEHETDLIIHPAFLDKFVHLVWPILGAGATGLDSLYMPTIVKSVKIDSQVVRSPGETLSVWCKSFGGTTGIAPVPFDLSATKPGFPQTPLIKFESFTMTPIANSNADQHTEAKKICFKLATRLFQRIKNNQSSILPVAMPLQNVKNCNGSTVVKTNLKNYANGDVENYQVNGIANPKGVNCFVNTDQNNQLKRSKEAHHHLSEGKIGYLRDGNSDSTETDVLVVHWGDGFEMSEILRGGIKESAGISSPLSQIDKKLFADRRIIILQTPAESLRTISPSNFETIQSILLNAKKVCWIYSHDVPATSLSVGLARTIRSENLSSIITLGVSSLCFDSINCMGSVANAVNALWFTAYDDGLSDNEFILKDDQLLIQRVEDDFEMNDFIHNETAESTFEKQLFKQQGRRLKLEIAQFGALDTLRFVDDIPGVLSDDGVEIEVRASGMNFKDVVVCMGQVAQPYIGVECSGVVSAVGRKVSHIRVGQRVMAMTEGAYSTYARCLASSAYPFPDSMTFEEAASIPVVFCTAYYGLFDLGHLMRGERVLIHAAAGGVGQAAIMLAQMVGADIFTTVGSKDKKQFLIDQYSIPADKIFYSRDVTFGEDIRRATNDLGIDVVLNSLSGDIFRETWKCLAPFGRFIEIGKSDITRNSRLDMNKFDDNCTFASVDLTKVASYKPRLMNRLLSDVCSLLSKGLITPIAPITTYTISKLEVALRSLQSGKAMGKLVVVPSAGDEIVASKPKVRSDILRPDGTYIIVGGTGGLGRSMAKWMSSKGARHIVLLSRSASINEKTQSLIDQLSPDGTHLSVQQCDVSIKASVKTLINEKLEAFPPIRGVIHGAMVLEDKLFEQMTLKDFHTVASCKVEGALNLHQILADRPLDFFIALSSIAGVVGNRGQAAYAAANVFLDELMRYRRSRNLPGVSIDLAAVSNVGYLADGSEARRKEVLKNIDADTLDEVEVLALLAAAITGKITKSSGGQCLTGLSTNNKDSFWINDAKFTALRQKLLSEDETKNQDGPQIALSKRLKATESREESSKILLDALSAKIAAVLMLALEEIEPTQTLKSFGLDSLVAIEIRNWIVRETEVNVQVLELLSSGSVINLAELILKKMGI